jgi:hypothetical protein
MTSFKEAGNITKDRSGFAEISTGHTQTNGAVLIVFTIKTAPFFCVCTVQAQRSRERHVL